MVHNPFTRKALGNSKEKLITLKTKLDYGIRIVSI